MIRVLGPKWLVLLLFLSKVSSGQDKAYPVLLDAALPPVLGKHVAGWVPTLTWSIQFKSVLTNSNRVSFRFRTTHIAGGYLEEDGELWDMSTGKLLAISRQLAMVGVSQRRRSNTTSAL